MARVQTITVMLLVSLAVLACGPPATTQAPAEMAGAAPSDERPDLEAFINLPKDVEVISYPWMQMAMETGGGELEMGVFLANTPQRRQRGLMYASGLPPMNVMLFVFENPPVHAGFWNANVPIDLEVAYLDGEGRIQEILKLEARSRDAKRPDAEYHYALEAPAGRFGALGIGVGSRLLVELGAEEQN